MNCIDIQKTNLETHLVCALGFIATCTEKKSVVLKLYVKPLLNQSQNKSSICPNLTYLQQSGKSDFWLSLSGDCVGFLSMDLIIVPEVLLWRFNCYMP